MYNLPLKHRKDEIQGSSWNIQRLNYLFICFCLNFSIFLLTRARAVELHWLIYCPHLPLWAGLFSECVTRIVPVSRYLSREALLSFS